MLSWELGLKANAIYRDGSKHAQAMYSSGTSSKTSEEEATAEEAIYNGLKRGEKKHMPVRRRGITVESSVGGQKIHLRTGEYEDGNLGEIFIDMFKEGASYRSLLNSLAVAVSIGLQYGVPLEKFVEKFTFTRFEPSGMTNHPNVRTCTSIIDFIFRVLGMEYNGRTDFVHVEPETTQKNQEVPATPEMINVSKAISKEQTIASESSTVEKEDHDTMDEYLKGMMGDAPACSICGHITVRNGSCYKCLNCGNSEGCS
jgi:ribonucleoside-diphosphate reductase alpha chain